MALKQNRKRKNTFDRMIEQYGSEEEFDQIRPDKLQRYAISLIKDIAFGNIDYEKQSKYFLNEMILQALLYELNLKISWYTSIKIPFDYYMSNSFNKPNISPNTANDVNMTYRAVIDILFCLNYIKNAVMVTSSTLDTSAIYQVPFALQQKRQALTLL